MIISSGKNDGWEREKDAQAPLEEATADLDRVISLNPDHAQALCLRAAAKISVGQYKEAVSDLNKAVELDPRNARALCARGTAKAGCGRYEEAVADLDRAVFLDPECTEAHRARETVKRFLGRQEEALAFFRSGVLKIGRGLRTEAVEDMNRALGLDSRYAKAFYVRGVLKGGLGKQEEAIADLNEAIRLYPGHAEAYFMRGTARRILGQQEETLADYNTAARLDPRIRPYHGWNPRRPLERYDRALDNLTRDVQENPGRAEPRFDQTVAEALRKSPLEQESLRKKAAELRRQAEETRERKALERQRAAERIRDRFRSDFPGADAFYEREISDVLSRKEYEREKTDFTRKWLSENTPEGREGKVSFSDEQVAAVARIGGNVQLVARAGSGKTFTLVSRALFLLGHCGVPAGTLLLLAFNRKAALEMRRRLLFALNADAEAALVEKMKAAGGGGKRGDAEMEAVDAVAEELGVLLPHVMTFHSLAWSIVHPEETLIYDDRESDRLVLSREVQRGVIDKLIRKGPESEIRDVMLKHFRLDWEKIVSRGYEKDREELLEFRRSHACLTVAGHFVDSKGRKLIADFLFEHDVRYRYRKRHRRDGIDYAPDFTVSRDGESGVAIEYLGPEYSPGRDRNFSEEVCRYWRKREGWNLVELLPKQVETEGGGNFGETLKEVLRKQGWECEKLSEDEIWFRVRDRAIDRFTAMTVNFINRSRQLSWTAEDAKNNISRYCEKENRPEEESFLRLASRIYSAYLERLSELDEEDFNGLLQRAAEMIRNRRSAFGRKSSRGDLADIRHMLIDEFQDFSPLFHELVSGIRKLNGNSESFCVGDDWQAINGFAGSDLVFFERFGEYFDDFRRLYLTTNYRSGRAIVENGNNLMEGLGRPARPYKENEGGVLAADLSDFHPVLLEDETHSGCPVTPAVLRLVGKSLEGNGDVTLLCRTNDVPGFADRYEDDATENVRGLDVFLDRVRSHLAEGLRDRVSISTVHRYKGLEKDTVVILDAFGRRYPLIHPDWIFTRIFGDGPEKIMREERRLFYVAITRPIEKLIIVTDRNNQAPFLETLQGGGPFPEIDWNELDPVLKTSKAVVKVGNLKGSAQPTYRIKDSLKAAGYLWRPKESCWAKSFPEEDVDSEKLRSEEWAVRADGIEVRIFDGAERNCLARYTVNAGRWKCEFDSVSRPKTGR